VPRWLLLVAKLVPYYAIGLAQMGILFGIGALLFDLHVAGSLWALLLLCVAMVWAAVALGLLFASVATSERMLGSVGSVTLLVMGILGGTMLPRFTMPTFMQKLGLLTPHAWALDGFHDIVLDSTASVADVLAPMAVLGAFGIGFATIGALRFHHQSSG
jgi:ABC-2 type transport system permease protein